MQFNASAISSVFQFLASEEITDFGGAVPFGYSQVSILEDRRQSVVYRAVDDRSGCEVVIKMMRPEVASEVAQELISWEATVLDRLAGRFAPRLVDVGQTASDKPFLVMQFVEGASVVDQISTLSQDDGRELAASVLEALEEVHSNGVIHGDLKPEHIVKDRHGVIHFLDFGLAALVQAERPSGFLRGIRGGTEAYLSPEQAESPALLPSVASDVYSMGIILRDCLASDARVSAALSQAVDADPSRRHRSAKNFATELQRKRGKAAYIRVHTASIATVFGIAAVSMLSFGSIRSASPMSGWGGEDALARSIERRAVPTIAEPQEMSGAHFRFEEPLLHGVLLPQGSGVLGVTLEGEIGVVETDRSVRMIARLHSVRHLSVSSQGDQFSATCDDGSVWLGDLASGKLDCASEGEGISMTGFDSAGGLYGWSPRARRLGAISGNEWAVLIERGGPLPNSSGGLAYVTISEDGRSHIGLAGEENAPISLEIGETPVSVSVNDSDIITAVGLKSGVCLVRRTENEDWREVRTEGGRPIWGVVTDASGDHVYSISDEVSVINVSTATVVGRLTGVLNGLPFGVSLSEASGIIAATNEEMRWWQPNNAGIRLASR